MNNEQSKDIDTLTQIASRHKFHQYFEEQWQRLALEQKPLSLIYCDIDSLKYYNDYFGRTAGDDCICQIASSIRDTASSLVTTAITARCGGDEFWVILPQTDATDAIQIAESIRSGVKALQIHHAEINALQIHHANFVLSKFVTVSLGVSTTIPDINILPENLIKAVDEAVGQAKNDGRDRVIFKEFTANLP
ncbi:MAG TPA: diguanylate cyclase [Kamptonema sp.]|nr:diguanylate cyclase [Kamptonema sp.]